MKRQTLIAGVACLSLGVLSCKNPNTTTATSPLNSQLIGTWTSRCVASNSSKSNANQTATFDVESHVFTTATDLSIQKKYKDSICSSLLWSTQITSTYTIIGSSSMSITPINLTISHMTRTLNDSDVVTAFNASVSDITSIASCAPNGWSLNVPVDISSCKALGSILSAGKVDYDIFGIIGTQLQFGESSSTSNTSSATRPTNLDATVIYFKQ